MIKYNGQFGVSPNCTKVQLQILRDVCALIDAMVLKNQMKDLYHLYKTISTFFFYAGNNFSFQFL